MNDKKESKVITDEVIIKSIKSLLANFQESMISKAFDKGLIPKDIYAMSKEEIIDWYEQNSTGSDKVESAILTILEKNHGMGGFESAVTLNRRHLESYLTQIIRVTFGHVCCADKAYTVMEDLINSYKGQTEQYGRHFGHPIISSKHIWKNIVETCPIITMARPMEHSRAIQELKKLSDHIEGQKDEFLVNFYQEFMRDPELLREGNSYQLAKDLGINEAIFPMKEEKNGNSEILVRVLMRESFYKNKKNSWYLYQYVQKNCPKAVREIKARIKLLNKRHKRSIYKLNPNNLEHFHMLLPILLQGKFRIKI